MKARLYSASWWDNIGAFYELSLRCTSSKSSKGYSSLYSQICFCLFVPPETRANTQPEGGKKLRPQLPASGVTNLKKYVCGVELDFYCGLIPLQAVVSASVKEPSSPPTECPLPTLRTKGMGRWCFTFKNTMLAFGLASKFKNTGSCLNTAGTVWLRRHMDRAVVLLQPQHPWHLPPRLCDC